MKPSVWKWRVLDLKSDPRGRGEVLLPPHLFSAHLVSYDYLTFHFICLCFFFIVFFFDQIVNSMKFFIYLITAVFQSLQQYPAAQ